MSIDIESAFKGLSTADPLLPAAKAAAMLGIAVQTLAVWRHRSNNGKPAPALPYVKLRSRAIRYRLSDLKTFIDESRQQSKAK